MIKMGSIVRDKITGFSGTATGKASYITGCDQYLVQPPSKDGEFKEGRWFDEGRLVVDKEGIDPKEVQAEENGCDASAPIK